MVQRGRDFVSKSQGNKSMYGCVVRGLMMGPRATTTISSICATFAVKVPSSLAIITKGWSSFPLIYQYTAHRSSLQATSIIFLQCITLRWSSFATCWAVS